MTIPIAEMRNELQRPNRRLASCEKGVWNDYRETKIELAAALVRERKLLRQKSALLERQDMLAREFEHRLLNSLQVIVSLLSLQSRAATTVEAAAQLSIAAERVGGVWTRASTLASPRSSEECWFKPYLQHLCDDLADLLLPSDAGRALVVTGTNVKLPTALGIPLGFNVSELITNSSKYAKGDITVRIEKSATAQVLSVSDGGLGLPAEFDVASSKELGMKIIQALVKQIGGTLQFAPGDDGRGTRVAVAFTSQP